MMKTKTTTDIQTRTSSRNLQTGARESKDSTQDTGKPHIALVGFMGAGKSAVGKALGQRLKVPFIDLDEVIVQEAGMSIPDIFKNSGEVAFRAKERRALRNVLQSDTPCILATGGGTFMDDTMRENLNERAQTVYLKTDVATLMGRLSNSGEIESRPLLTGPDPASTVDRLLKKRTPVYEQCEKSVTTTARSVEDVVAEIMRSLQLERAKRTPRAETPHAEQEVAQTSMHKRATQKGEAITIHVSASSGDYEVELRPTAGPWIAEGIAERCKGSKLAVITDTTVARLHADDFVHSLKKLGKDVLLIQVEPGEKSKTLGTASRLYEQLLEHGMTRQDAVVSLGGGVVGDLGGFVASTFLRGVGFFQVPTTTLAAVDSSVGGKTAVNTPRGKNLVGTFYPAKKVFIAASHLATQSPRQNAAGLIEALKMAATLDIELFETIVDNAQALLDFEPQTLLSILGASVAIKARVVSEDEREAGLRAVLNYGHTVGHAIEAGENFQMLHGEAVALGMIAEAQWAEMEGYGNQVSSSLRQAVESLGFIPEWRKKKIDIDALSVDKKRIGSGVKIPIVSQIGSFDFRTVPVSALAEFVKRRSTI
ncbi:MAG: 3-dehydroquinate synthase [Deltaproteobacteria bacterium]|nr:3-dehydroquinate synthase [Deltaproteobacteria bacterium]